MLLKQIGQKDHGKGFIIPTMQLSGLKQMALDENLLDLSIQRSSIAPIFRFYNWDGCWVSIGKNQKEIPKKWIELVNKKKIKMVRRPSGGTGVIHLGGITYSLIWPLAPRKKKESYFRTCKWIINGFKVLGVKLDFGIEVLNQSNSNCFAKPTSADLVDENGVKIIGSSQLWRKGYLLQHGEIIINPPKEIWLEIFNVSPPTSRYSCINKVKVIRSLKDSIIELFPDLEWEEIKLNENDFKDEGIDLSKYFPP